MNALIQGGEDVQPDLTGVKLRKIGRVWSTIVVAGMMLLGGAVSANAAGDPAADLAALVKAAQAEGILTFYWSSNGPVAQRLSEAFEKKYGIKSSFVRLTSGPLFQRYAGEAESNNFAADFMLSGGGVAVTFAQDGIKKGWVQAVSEAGLPVITSGQFPAKFNRGATAVVQVAPWQIAYNTELLKKNDYPKDWPDLLKPGFKGQILLGDPRNAGTYMEFWTMIMEKYGESFITQMAMQSGRHYDSGVPAVQGLGAGEGSIHLPVISSQAQTVREKGAPVDTVTPDYNTGLEFQVILTAPNKAKHPNAARLFANYIMSPDGNAVFNSDPGGFTIYETAQLPKQYVAPNPGAADNKDKLGRLLGFQK